MNPRQPLGEVPLGYVIAAYALVLGSLLAYGLWVQSQRRALRGEGERRPREDRDGDGS